MIKSLKIKNVALIDSATIDFSTGLNVLSGETGAGKSVILDSLNFALGAKADKTMIRYGEEECLVTAIFDVSDSNSVKNALKDLGLDEEDELIITRKLSVDGKGSIRVNGEPFTASMLKSVTSLIVDIHGQSEHYSLLKTSEQLKVLDRFSGVKVLKIKDKIKEITALIKAEDELLSSFGGSESERAMKIDILKFQIDEIKAADLKDGEEEELILKNNRIKNAEKIAEALSAMKNLLDGENMAEDVINSSVKAMERISSIDERYSVLSERLKAISSEISDISMTAEDLLSDTEFDENEAYCIDSRLDLIKSLKKKYGADVKTINAFLLKAEEEYEKAINFDVEYEKCLSRKSELLDKLNELYKQLSDLRRETAIDFCLKVKRELAELGMKNSDFTIDFKPFYEIDDAPYPENGVDDAEFMFSANLGEPLKPLSKIISGGEMSRFMLALKVIISDYQEISTYVFDEIDAGLSGAGAEVVAEKFAKIAKKIQIIAISHLPKICAMADHSLKIEKTEKDGKTYTSIKALSENEKIDEIVRIIGGNGSDIAKLHAEEMIAAADKFKSLI